MSTTFALDSGSALQADGLTVEEDSRTQTLSQGIKASRRRRRAPRPVLKNPNTPFPGRPIPSFSAPSGDSHTQARCREALRWITTLPEGAVQIQVEAGHVTLSGTVAHASEREVAYDAVHQVEGVVDVDNRIEVR